MPGSTAVHMVTGHFRRPGTEDIVLCKENALELLCRTEEGSWESLCEQDVYGSVVQLEVLSFGTAQSVRPLTRFAESFVCFPVCFFFK